MGKAIGMFVEHRKIGRVGEFERLSKLTDEELKAEVIEDIREAQKLIERVKRPARDDPAAS